ncbi:aldehyde dehydrogenase [Mycolicibacterium novocastrense]|uniref:aldehyde dehydrogenase family protein n=1 Tax=Mycolicibacterium novocastrense TaxID=59813 RepID=UPI0007462FB7|nr:aldehyde dehydrogenase family protein [Mycolicibacterium novocastrense]KUH69836.1 aldehyde dehydrogenase [Mycolicibacterium novocastrense]KUH71410.1 aldehyde dehydrogenase [Mycolicibacterium novocastrense]KUH74462.1 aldehyde dehydrogenase [Mycolicibacterium novocastrense]
MQIADLRRATCDGRTRGLQWRLDQLRGIERLLSDSGSDIAAALADDLGRSSIAAHAGDVAPTLGEARYARTYLKRWMRPRHIRLPRAHQPGRSWVQYEPLGVVLIIGAWNFPIYLSIGPLVGAVAAGNAAVIKPSELAPATSALLARVVPEYLDPDAIRVVEGDGQTTQDLLAQSFDHAVFTGGTEIGKKVMAGAAATLTPVTLELGGKSPVIVAADADLDVAARRIASMKLLNSGQMCIAPDYVLAESTIIDDLVARIVANVAEFCSAAPDPLMPIVNERQFDRLVSLIDSTSGQVVLGGESDRSRLRIHPTVIVGPSATDAVMADEIFGPILPIVPMDSVDNAVDFVNSQPKPLALYVFTASERLGRSVIDRAQSGGAVINDIAVHCLAPQLPFGGVGASGIGAYHGRWGFEALSHRRAVLARPAASG